MSAVEGGAASGEEGFAGSRSALSGEDAAGEGFAVFSSAASCLDRVFFSSVRVFCSSLRRAIFCSVSASCLARASRCEGVSGRAVELRVLQTPMSGILWEEGELRRVPAMA